MIQRDLKRQMWDAREPVAHQGELIDLPDFFDPKYMDPELPDDFFYDRIAEVFKNDISIKVLSDPLILEGVEMSKVIVIDFDDNSVHVGPKKLAEPAYVPKEDFVSTNIVLDWLDDFRVGIKRDLPDLPMPRPVIPENQYFKPYQQYFVENFFAMRGAYIADASMGMRLACPDFVYCQIDLKDQDVVKAEEIMVEYDTGVILDTELKKPFFFKPYRDIKKKNEIYDKINYVAMQFNPFHPMAVSMIESMIWVTDSKVVGTYRYMERELKFKYDFNDQRYRIHSHIWLQIARGYKFCGALEVYDLVGNFDFNSILKLKDKHTYVEPLIIEPISPQLHYNKKTKEYYLAVTSNKVPYSNLGQGNYFQRGTTEIAYCMYANYTLHDDSKHSVWAIDVTEEVELEKTKLSLKYDGKDYSFRKKELQAEHIFFKWYDDDKFKAYEIVQLTYKGKDYHTYSTAFREYHIRIEELDNFKEYFVENELAYKFYYVGDKFFSFPRNMNGSLVLDFRTITLQDAVKMDSTTLHEYWPYLVPYTDDCDAGDEHTNYMFETEEVPLNVLEYAENMKDAEDVSKVAQYLKCSTWEPGGGNKWFERED